MVAEGKKRIQISVTDDMYNRLDNYAKRMGVSKSMLCALCVGQYVMTLDTAISKFENAMDDKDGQLPLPGCNP